MGNDSAIPGDGVPDEQAIVDVPLHRHSAGLCLVGMLVVGGATVVFSLIPYSESLALDIAARAAVIVFGLSVVAFLVNALLAGRAAAGVSRGGVHYRRGRRQWYVAWEDVRVVMVYIIERIIGGDSVAFVVAGPDDETRIEERRETHAVFAGLLAIGPTTHYIHRNTGLWTGPPLGECVESDAALDALAPRGASRAMLLSIGWSGRGNGAGAGADS